MSEYYSKEELSRMVNYISSVRTELETTLARVSNYDGRRMINESIFQTNQTLWKWKAKLDRGEMVSK